MAVNRMRSKRLIETDKDEEGRIFVKLTSLGNELLNSEHTEVWDGKYRIVAWDIPENKRRIRNLFRRKLKEWKFVQLQKSVWVSKRNVTKKLKNMVSEYGMERWVVVIESEDHSLDELFI